jgi:hypothetical protein
MTRTLAQALTNAIPSVGAMLAQAPSKVFEEAGIGAAILLTVAGVVLHWHLPRHRMSMEERMKDGKLTEEEARRQLRFYGWCAPLTTLLGVVVLVVVLFDLIG